MGCGGRAGGSALGPPFGRERDDERGGGARFAPPPRRVNESNPHPELQRALSAWLEEEKGAGKCASRANPTLPPRAQRTMSWGSAREARRPAPPTQSEARDATEHRGGGVWMKGMGSGTGRRVTGGQRAEREAAYGPDFNTYMADGICALCVRGRDPGSAPDRLQKVAKYDPRPDGVTATSDSNDNLYNREGTDRGTRVV
ncbi:hypothetical protein B0H16DRAFT_1480002 [Mycena metata]|uniref:Uncharacterized protein n=1 Tax=Mycena metata TaxID=1033252 RepID=A0AAD7MDM4_9AGAR|nr:hypothetical protein B0H16DRAFT_1480002 [Mycena metata]